MKYMFFLVLALLCMAGCQTGPREPLAQIPAAVVTAEKQVTLKDGRTIAIPEPVLWPEHARETPEYAQWSDRGDVRTLTFKEADGRVVQAGMVFVWRKPGDPVRYAGIQSLTRFRADGTREVATLYTPSGWPLMWTAYAADGVTPTITVNQDVNEKLKTAKIGSMEVYEAAGKKRLYLRHRDGKFGPQ